MIRSVNVTKTSIRKGVRGDMYNCAVARACKASRIGSNVSVNWAAVMFTRYGNSYTWALPKAVRNFIGKFDDDDLKKTSLRPVSFTVKVRES